MKWEIRACRSRPLVWVMTAPLCVVGLSIPTGCNRTPSPEAGSNAGLTAKRDTGPASQPGSSNSAKVATVVGRPIYLSDLDLPDYAKESWLKNRGQEAYEAYLAQNRPAKLWGLIFQALMNDYCGKHGITVSDQEMEVIRRRSRQSMHQWIEHLEAKRDAVCEQIESASTSAPAGQEKLAELERLDRSLAAAKARQAGTQPSTGADTDAFMKMLLLMQKLSRDLYEKYGGRVGVYTIGGLSADEAIEKWLRDCERKGLLEIHDPVMRKAFWDHSTDLYKKADHVREYDPDAPNPFDAELQRVLKPDPQ